MSKQSLERECARENNENRRVDLVRNQRMDDFWRRSRGNFFITGDENIYSGSMYNTKTDSMAQTRRQMLLSAVRNSPDFSRGTLVIIHNDDVLENEMIRMAGTLNRQLIVISEQYRNYHLFYKMDIEKILACFDEVGRMCGYHNMADTDAYTRAFMEIVECGYPVSMQSMIALSRKSDQEIHNIAQSYGVDFNTLQDFDRAANTNGRDTFRRILERIRSALGGITRNDCDTKFNMITACGKNEPPRIILINVNSSAPEIFNLYFRHELDEVRGQQISVIIDDIPTFKEDGLISAVKNIGRNQYGAAGLCAGDIFNMADEKDLKGFSTHCIFRHADPGSLETLLNSYGTYRYAYVQEANALSEGRFFVLMPQRTYTKAYVEKHPRIMMQDMSFAVLKGHNAERPAIVDSLS